MEMGEACSWSLIADVVSGTPWTDIINPATGYSLRLGIPLPEYFVSITLLFTDGRFQQADAYHVGALKTAGDSCLEMIHVLGQESFA